MLACSLRHLNATRQSLAPILRRGLALTAVDNGDIKNITVLGGGLMGSGIAQLCAQNGYEVCVVDSDEYTQKCQVAVCKSLLIISKKRFPNEDKIANQWYNEVFNRIRTTQSYDVGCEKADLVIETIVEDLLKKQAIYKKVDGKIKEDAILATNTSSLSIADLSEGLQCSDRFIGLHFFNPVWFMKLVEVIPMVGVTSHATTERTLDFVSDIGKTAIKCNDTPGFIVNHLLYPFMMEAVRMVEREEANSIEDIDTAMKLGAGLPMGPFEMLDVIGIDTVQQVIQTWNEKNPEDPRYFPSATIDDLVRSKKLGMKTKQGFYPYRHTLY